MSKLTFNEVANDVAWQKQLRDKYESDGAPDVSLDLKLSRVRRVSSRVASAIILKYEWLGTMVRASHCFGIFFGPYCAGVTCIGLGSGGANINAHMEWGIERKELAYLARGANAHWSPTGANSRLVSWSCKLLRAEEPSAKLIIAYSDTDAGEIGTIYQACNWVCVGKGSVTLQYVSPDGLAFRDQKFPKNLAVTHGGTRYEWHQRLTDAGWTTQKTNAKYRYVYVLDPKDRRLIDAVESKRVAYPKRPKQAMEAPTSQRQCDTDPAAPYATQKGNV